MTKKCLALLEEFYGHAAELNWSPFAEAERSALRIFVDWLDGRPMDSAPDYAEYFGGHIKPGEVERMQQKLSSPVEAREAAVTNEQVYRKALEMIVSGSRDGQFIASGEMMEIAAAALATPVEPSLPERETATRQIPSARGDIAASGPRNGPDPGIPVSATIREAENDEGEVEHHIECRFADGQKYAAAAVSLECGELAALIVRAIEQHNAVEPRCDATWQPLVDGPVIPCTLPAGHSGKHRAPEPFTQESLLRGVRQCHLDYTTAVVRNAFDSDMTKEQFLTMVNIAWDARQTARSALNRSES